MRVVEWHPAGPLLAERLDESLRLAVGPGRVEPGADVPQPQCIAGLRERLET
jgi:hypothetical protein